MKRMILGALRSWQKQPARKPLLIRGARQVGKTWVVRELGKLFKEFVEINFELYPEAKKIFHPDLDPARISRDLSLLMGKRIVPGETLIFLDEHKRSRHGVRLSGLNFAADDRLFSMPLYAIAMLMNLTKEQVSSLL